MKKRIAPIIALVMSLIMSVSVISGCKLLTPNTERDFAQVVATVNIGNENAETEVITKKDMIMAYMNYGYNYIAQGLTQQEVFDFILDGLIDNRVLLQYSMKYFEENGGVVDSSKEKWSTDRYLTADEIYEATYATLKAVNALIDTFEEDEKSALKDTLAEEVRTTPTDAKNAEKEVSLDEKKDYVDNKGIITGEVGEERYTAYNKALKYLKNNALLGQSVKNLAESDYYIDNLKAQKEAKVIEKYEKVLVKTERAKLTYADLAERYQDMYLDQKNKYEQDVTAFAEALAGATAVSPIVYNNTNGSYGYVYNLLLGVNAEQTQSLEAIKTTDTKEYNVLRNQILKATEVKDLRSTWILSGYDFDGTKFTGDYAFLENSLPFKGTVEKIADATEEKNAEYKVKSVDKFGLDEFIAEMDSYLGITNGVNEADSSKAVYRRANVAKGTIADYEKKINELLFAFSTDAGSLNTYKGYLIQPNPDFDGKDEWVKTFADAGREIMSMGGNSYIIVASDFGYHVLFYSEIFSVDSNYPTLESYLNHLTGENKDANGWAEYYADMLEDYDNADKDSYLYLLAETYGQVQNKVDTIQNNTAKSYRLNSQYVVKNFDAYKDLVQG